MAPRALFFVPFLFAAAASVSCSTAKPKQAEEPDPLKDSGQDMASADTSAADGAKKDTVGEDAMHGKCCAQCKDALAKDRSGEKPENIPCVDYSDLEPWCTEHFRVKPTLASACN